MGYKRKLYTVNFTKTEMLIFLFQLIPGGKMASRLLVVLAPPFFSRGEKSRGSFNIA